MTDNQSINISETLRLHELWLADDSTGIRADLRYANLSGADLRDANLRKAILTGANLYDANLTDANLSYANLYGCNLTGANLYDANLTDAILSGANLSYANLYGCNLTGADLRDANLRKAILSGANLSYANLSRANLYGCNLTGANLSGANLSGAKGLPIVADHLQRLRAVASEVLSNPQNLHMTNWHNECGTAHCLAGWAIHQAGTLGEVLEKLHGPHIAGLLLLGADAAAHFYDSNEEAIEWLQSVAQEAA